MVLSVTFDKMRIALMEDLLAPIIINTNIERCLCRRCLCEAPTYYEDQPSM
jgi:hypothetical protein